MDIEMPGASSEVRRHGALPEAVVVTHNSMRDLEGFLECTPLRASFSRILVVDNASIDGTPDAARAGGLEVIARSTNDGFGAAANIGVGLTSSEFVCVLNPDIRFTGDDVLPKLMRHFSDPAAAVIAPALILPDGSLQDSAREVPGVLNLLERRIRRNTAGAIRPQSVACVPWVVGAFLLLRRSAFLEVDGFDEVFRLYFDDVDLCLRLGRHGWKVLFEPNAAAHHIHRAESRRSVLRWATRQHIRSATLFYIRHWRARFSWREHFRRSRSRLPTIAGR
jgi:GT2 family glycosyltransferase